jgi:hypothetical protein
VAYLAVCEVLNGIFSGLAAEILAAQWPAADSVELIFKIKVILRAGLPPFHLHVSLQLF